MRFLPITLLLLLLTCLMTSCGENTSSAPILEPSFSSSSEWVTIFSSSAVSSSSFAYSFSEVAISSESLSSSEESSSSLELSSSSADTLVVAPHGIPYLKITTENSVAVDSVYVSCSVQMNGNGTYENYSASGAKIRQRGNSTRLYYDKKPYRIKLASKASLLGMDANKDWVLLANYRDPTDMMNAFAFDMARTMGNFAFVNSNRFVDVELNGDYIGLYQLTEQIERSETRVNIDKTAGILLSLDADDGPDLSPNATNNFWSSEYDLPVAVKYPEDVSSSRRDEIKNDFALLERAIKNSNYDSVQILLDVPSFIDFIIIQEITRNVELEAPRSMYLYKANATDKYHFGPVWDFDGGFAFDWASMTDGHNYFDSQTWILGSGNPSSSQDGYQISGFFVNLFANSEFLSAYKSRWNELKSSLLTEPLEKLDGYASQTSRAMAADAERWPIDKTYSTEISRLKSWLETRVSNYTSVVDGY